ncbi:MAG: hypothetical protein GEU95_01020 [Rhizobiales bacterium]|nr:hypothetical protein [Hyphomicrobiales bacterium]
MDYFPIAFRWTGEAMRPLPRCAQEAANRFAVGETYLLVEDKQRSSKTHRHQFAWVNKAWLNLPEWAGREPWAVSPDSLRKYALIRRGFCTTSQVVCDSHAEALRWCAFMREQVDEYVLVSISDTVVTTFRAESQKMKAMGARRFQQSKEAIFDFIARHVIGVEPENLDTFAREVGFQRIASPPIAPEQDTETEKEKA